MQRPHLATGGRLALLFALGKAYDDLGDYAVAIRHFDAANALRGAGRRLDRDWLERQTSDLIAATPPGFLEPSLGILDETDSGLDIDALRTVANGVNKLRTRDRSFIIVTHYQRLLNYIVPDVVHVLSAGRIVKSGGKELALELEDKGYDWLSGGGDQPEVAA